MSPFVGAYYARGLSKYHSTCSFWSIMVSFTSIAPFILALLYKNVHAPIVLTLQEGDSLEHIESARLGLIGFCWKYVLQRVDHLQVISTYLGNVAKKYGFQGQYEVVPNGVDLTKIIYNTIPSNNKVPRIIITTSRLVEKNAIDILIRAFAKVWKKFPDAWLYIVGDGLLRKELEDLSKSLTLGESVRFFGSVSFEKIPQLLIEADIFVRPSRSEGLGTSFLEAMGAGLPIIGTSVGGIPDFLIHEKTGLFCKVNDVEDLAEKISRLMNDRVLYEKLSLQGRELIERSYNWDSIAGRMKQILTNPL